MIKACKKYIKTFKARVKEAKNAKKIEADKQSANPKHYPLQLSQNEIEYVRNALSSAGGGGIFGVWLWWFYLFGDSALVSACYQRGI